MALVIEDGTIVDNANSVSTLAAIKAYALDRNITLPDDDDVLNGYAVLAMDYLETFKDQYIGSLVDPDQPLSWPRTDVTLNGAEFPADGIPVNLIAAQQQLVVEQSRGVKLQPVLIYADRIKRKKTGPLETEWFDAAATGIAPAMPQVDSLLAPLILPQVMGLRTVRV